MNSLLKFVIDAHGGLEHWRQFTDLVVDVDVRGELCERRKWSGMVPESRVLLSLRGQRTIVLLPGGQGGILVHPDLISRRDQQGAYVDGLAHPKETMIRENSAEGWDFLRTAYFMSHAVRHSLTAPFLYSQPGFLVEEIAPWSENGETWRVLRVTFPADFSAPAQTHLAYYNPEGMLRRTRNDSKIVGGLDLVEYVTSYERVNGIWMATSKDVFECDSAGKKIYPPRMGQFEYRNLFLTI